MPTRQRLYINVDHVATIRQARRTDEPDPVAAARAVSGARRTHGIAAASAALKAEGDFTVEGSEVGRDDQPVL